MDKNYKYKKVYYTNRPTDDGYQQTLTIIKKGVWELEIDDKSVDIFVKKIVKILKYHGTFYDVSVINDIDSFDKNANLPFAKRSSAIMATKLEYERINPEYFSYEEYRKQFNRDW